MNQEDFIDDDYQYQEYIRFLRIEEEKHEFFNIFTLTNTYPI